MDNACCPRGALGIACWCKFMGKSAGDLKETKTKPVLELRMPKKSTLPQSKPVLTQSKPKSVLTLTMHKHVEDAKPSAAPLEVFTDGSAINNGKKNARAGFAVVWPERPDLTSGYPLAGPKQSNNRAEYCAALKAVEQAGVIDPDGLRALRIFTDSELLIKTATTWIKGWKRKGWKTKDGSQVKNLDLVMALDHAMSGRRPIQFVHVKAHTGGRDRESVYNDQADALAKKAVTQT